MPFIKSFFIDAQKLHPFPFNIPAVQFARDIALDKKVTIFAGDNGSGKSTLLESIAYKINLPLIGGSIQDNPGFEAASILQPYLNMSGTGKLPEDFFSGLKISVIL